MKQSYFTKILWTSFCIVCFFSCKQPDKNTSLFRLKTNSGIDFENTVTNTKDFNIFSYRNFYNGGGVAIGDLNNDGLDDVFFTANMSSNKLYLNKGNFKFEDITKQSGISTDVNEWSTGVTLVDINGDGWLDIFVCNAGYINRTPPQCKLYINNKNLTFTEEAAQYGLTNYGGYTTHAAFFDYDNDGDLDCFIINNSFIPVNTLNYANKRDLPAKDWPVADFLKGGGDHLLRNDNGKFVDVSQQAGIHGSLISFGLGISVADINGDGYLDVYVSNDFFERDYLYINQKNGTFKDVLEQYMQHTSLASMGSDVGDINNDGHPDLFTTDMLPDKDYRLKTTSSFESIDVYKLKERSGFYHQFMQNCLQLNDGTGNFDEIAHYSGVQASDWSWGALMFDANNDGRTDIYVCNGIYHDVTDQDFIDFFANDVIQKMVLTGEKQDVDDIVNKMPSQPLINKMFYNEGNLKFADSAQAWGFTKPSFSNGAAYGDLDNDGDLDLVINNVNEKAFVYENFSRQINKNHFIGIKLKGKDKNTFAIGSTIKVYQGNNVFTREIMPSRGFQSSVSYKQIIGLGKGDADSMIITWPDETYSKFIHPAIDTVQVIQEPSASTKYDYSSTPVHPMFDSLPNIFDKHNEDNYIDFYNDRNIPMMLSREGPKAAIGDVNGDRLDDIYICGARNQPGHLYLQTASGGFIKKDEKSFNDDSSFEDVSATFFDCDNDGDLDLVVGSGGNISSMQGRFMQNRLYRNDGHGNFVSDENSLPYNTDNNSVIIAADFDGDGDSDLFVGSRSVVSMYGITPKSFLLMNDGKGRFTDISATKNQDIKNIGLVTGAAWADVTGDGKKDLIITGEWMNPRIFSYNGDHFVEVKTNLSGLLGWWQSMAVADVNADGKQDLILGNIGENFYLQPNATHPIKLWINDFDKNGNTEKVLTCVIDNKDVPVFLKSDMQNEIPGIKKQNLKHADYATKSIQDLFGTSVVEKSDIKEFNYSASVVAINEGGGKFQIKELPAPVQFSCVNSICCSDINNDGFVDLIFGCNKTCFLPQFGRLDASRGDVLLNDGKGNFSELNSVQSGIKVEGVVRDVHEIKTKDKRCFLFLRNDDYPILYRLNNENNLH